MSIRKALKKSKDLQSIYDFFKVILFEKSRISKIKSYFDSTNSPKLHLGCGSNVLAEWLNTDFSNPTSNIIFLDVTKTFPFDSNSFQYVLAEHLIEHIHYKDAEFMAKEIYRITKSGGVCRIATPNLDKYLKVYSEVEMNDFYRNILERMTDDWIVSGFYNAKNYVPPKGNYNPAFFLNDIFMNYEHKYIYNTSTLIDIFQRAGFVNIKVVNAGKSEINELNGVETHVDDINAFLTLTIEAEKI